MLRFFIILIVTALAITVVRSALNLIARGFSDLTRPQSPGNTTASTPPTGGELKRDPVCGTYIASENSVRKVVKGETLYFCSPECRDKYPPS